MKILQFRPTSIRLFLICLWRSLWQGLFGGRHKTDLG